jgi:hypothetical protein
MNNGVLLEFHGRPLPHLPSTMGLICLIAPKGAERIRDRVDLVGAMDRSSSGEGGTGLSQISRAASGFSTIPLLYCLSRKHGMKKLCFGNSAAVHDENPIQPKVEHDAGWKLRFDVPAGLRACREGR